jgi:hypothetical protein
MFFLEATGMPFTVNGATPVRGFATPEARLYRLLRERLADTTVFSIGHRATLRAFHARQLLVRANGTGPSSIVEVTAVLDSARSNVAIPLHEKVASLAG